MVSVTMKNMDKELKTKRKGLTPGRAGSKGKDSVSGK
jgi:hypothetical protein